MYQNPDSAVFSRKRRAGGIAGAGTIRLHPVPLRGKVALAVFTLFTVLYFSYRIPLWNPQAPTLSSLLLAAEIFGTFTLFLHAISTWCLVERHAPPVPSGYEADIFITTWNESAEILRHTLLAAKQVAHARTIWLLDDGGRAEMEALARELGVKYLSRTDRSHAKAGNLNNALKHTDAEFIAIFDCDHAPSPEFLERTLGYFADPSVAFVQTPQDFYNVDSFQHRLSARRQEAWHEQTLFYRVIQAGKDYWNATFFCGSCAIMRRAALESVGGIATGTITEDMHTSLRLHKHGWTAIYHAEALAFGLSPTDLEQYETQRLRWGRGAMQVWAKEGILFTGGLSFAQRIAYLTSAITYFEGWQKAIIYIMPIVVLTTGWMPIIWTGLPFICLFLTWLISGMIVNEVFSRGYAKTIWMEEYNFLRFYTFMKATLALAIPINWGFSVTPKHFTSEGRFSIRLWPQLLVATAAILSIPIGSWLYRTSHHLPQGAFIANLIWTTLSATIAIKALRFVTGRTHQRRTEHRFVVPLIARLRLAGGDEAPVPETVPETVAVIAEDVSSHGFSFTFNDERPLGDRLEGELRLPSGPLPFRAGLVSDRVDKHLGLRRVAARFFWEKPADADRLNACLYGNTLQWDVNGWAETRNVRLKIRLLRLLGKDGEIPGRWRFARLAADGGSGMECTVRREGELFRVLAFEPLPAMNRLTLDIGKVHEVVSGLQVAGYREYSVGGGAMHMAVLNEPGGASAVHYHREPSWMREVETA